MVSIVLLTTEEVLKRNVFWHYLDATWIAEELEPFKKVKQEHSYTKPLSRDTYYAKNPDIPRSESEDESSLTVSGFKTKHKEWKSKIYIRKVNKRHSIQSNSSTKSGKNISLETCVTQRAFKSSGKEKTFIFKELNSDQERVKNFFDRLLESVPPPPLDDIDSSNNSAEEPKFFHNLSNFDVLDYTDFENNIIAPKTSTLKKSKNKVSFGMTSVISISDSYESWYETIYGLSEIVKEIKCSSDSDDISWSDVVNSCGLKESALIREEIFKSEFLISKSHGDSEIFDISGDEDTGYAKFEMDILNRSLKMENGLLNSSSIISLHCKSSEIIKINALNRNQSFYDNLYRIAPVDME